MSRYTRAEWVLTKETRHGRPVVCLTTDMVYEVGFLGSGWELRAKAGFCTDLTSMPKLPGWAPNWLVGFRDWCAEQLSAASIPHDLMRRDRRWPKLLGDYTFFEAAGVTGAPLWLRLAAFGLVLLNFTRD